LKALRQELTQQELNRLSMAQLIEHGRQALQGQAYERAASMFRESVRRAPFRQDLKELLAMAVEGSLQNKQMPSRGMVDRLPAPPPPRPDRLEPPAERMLPPERPPQRERFNPDRSAQRMTERRPDRMPEPVDDGNYPEPPPMAHREFELPGFTPLPDPAPIRPSRPARPAPPGHPGYPARPTGYHTEAPRFHPGTGHGSRTQPALPVRRKPINFGKRHQRGPLSAIFLGGLAAVVVIALGGGFFWLYAHYDQVKGLIDQAAFSKAKASSIIERAGVYGREGKFTLAIELLNTLPDEGERNSILAKTFNDQGDELFKPPQSNYEGAIEAYKNAVKYDPNNPLFGNHLGESYFRLADKKQDNREVAKRYLALARQSYEAVLKVDPKNLDALKVLVRIATKQRDDILKAKTYKKIIEVAPDSEDAMNARRDSRSLGYRLD
jgi:tetratricopeptide (TPR) repeat protein